MQKKTEITEKRCGVCEKVLPVAKFSKMNANKDGLQNRCKDCQKIKMAEWVARNKTKKHPELETIHCPKCDLDLPAHLFTKAPGRKNGYAGLCKVCQGIQWKKWYAKPENHEKFNTYMRDRYAAARAKKAGADKK